MEKNRTKINVLDAESKLQACSGIWIPSGDVINDVSNADWFQSCGLFPSCHGRGGRVCDLPAQPCPPKTRPPCRVGHGSNPRRGRALGGLALAAPSSLCSHCPDPTEITSIPFVPECSLSQSIYYFFFLMGKRVAASFHSNTYAHNIVCSCHQWWLKRLASALSCRHCGSILLPLLWGDPIGITAVKKVSKKQTWEYFASSASITPVCLPVRTVRDMKQSGEPVLLQEGFPCQADHHH